MNWREKMRHLYLVLIFTQQHFFLLSEVHFYTTVIILGYTFLFYRFLLFCEQQFALNWDFFFLFNRLSIFLIVLLLEGLNKVKSILFETIRETQKPTHLPGSQNEPASSWWLSCHVLASAAVLPLSNATEAQGILGADLVCQCPLTAATGWHARSWCSHWFRSNCL